MTDEKYVLMQDVRDKKITARSAKNARTHTGRRGRVKLPSDYLSNKELEKMNGEVKSYRLNDPMKWREFKSMPDDLKVAYIKALRAKYAVPDKEIAEMFGVDRQTVGKWFRCLGLGLGKCAGAKVQVAFDEDGWIAWLNGVSVPATSEENTVVEEPTEKDGEIPVELFEPEPVHPESVPVAETVLIREEKAIPCSGNMTFEGTAESVLNTIRVLLGGANVRMSVTWEVCPEQVERETA